MPTVLLVYFSANSGSQPPLSPNRVANEPVGAIETKLQFLRPYSFSPVISSGVKCNFIISLSKISSLYLGYGPNSFASSLLAKTARLKIREKTSSVNSIASGEPYLKPNFIRAVA